MAELRRGLETYDAVGSGAALDLDALAASARRTGQQVTVSVTGAPVPLPAPTEQAVARVVREALTNASRHAPGAPVEVHLAYREDDLVAEVRDAGSVTGGFTGGSGTGLLMLAEHVARLGGRLEHGPGEHGYRVAVHLPVPRSVPA
jgi:signal transduction histidine kinase